MAYEPAEHDDPSNDGIDTTTDTGADVRAGFNANFDKAAAEPAEGATPPAPAAGAKPTAPVPGAAAAPAPGAAPVPGAAPAAPTRHAAPARWHQDAKAAWDALYGMEGAQPHLDSLHQQWERVNAYLTQQQQERAQYERQWTPIAEVVEPFRMQWAQQGMTVDQGLRQLMGYAQALATNPAETLLGLAEMYGVDLQQQLEDRPYVDPVTQHALTRVQQLESRLAQQDELAQRAQHANLVSVVRDFSQAKNADGSLKHPYFEDEGVFQDMLKAVAMGYAQDPETAYELVVNNRPDIRERIAAERKRAADQAAIQEAKKQSEAALKARGASGTMKGGSAGAGAAPSMKQAFEQNYQALAAR